MQEMLPAGAGAVAGRYAHDGEFWNFPTATSCPKPVQKEHPVWVAARAPITYDYAVKHGCNIMSWPLTREMDEAELYMDRLNEAMAANPGEAPDMAMMRHTAVYDRKEDWMMPGPRGAAAAVAVREPVQEHGRREERLPEGSRWNQLANRANTIRRC
jgi:alkanesulfonate monooxygenase SsuD/methylene tetrahydromethanopterin reductase-like flavin-dependent oxidoreductase (luciferase family)